MLKEDYITTRKLKIQLRLGKSAKAKKKQSLEFFPLRLVIFRLFDCKFLTLKNLLKQASHGLDSLCSTLCYQTFKVPTTSLTTQEICMYVLHTILNTIAKMSISVCCRIYISIKVREMLANCWKVLFVLSLQILHMGQVNSKMQSIFL